MAANLYFTNEVCYLLALKGKYNIGSYQNIKLLNYYPKAVLKKYVCLKNSHSKQNTKEYGHLRKIS